MQRLLLNDKQLKAEGLFAGEGFWVLERMPRELLVNVYAAPTYVGRVKALGIREDLVRRCTKEELSAIAGFSFHRGVIAIARRPAVTKLLPSSLNGGRYLVLSDIADPDNAGSLLRTAAAFGLDGIIVTPGTADLFSRKTVRSSMAQVFRLKIYSAAGPDCLDIFREAGVRIYAAAVGPGCTSLEESAAETARGNSWVMVLGNEGHGLSEDWLRGADVRVTVPMADGVDSLNVGVAGGILLYRLSN